ncbi:UNVERIFIED_CONTAM: RNA-binding protein 5 [Siphonaria sp. JEL0065]|nr:RNA-binding protein 5 [Siphonaria sp. JEL0065]
MNTLKTSQYRNRAAERRKMCGQPAKVGQAGRVHGIGDDNIGNKMLKAMGWKEGSGLDAKQGIVAPIAAEGYLKGAGVGSMPLMKK